MKARDEFCQDAMFSNAKLRLLMDVVGFERLGVEDVKGASWVIPSSLTSTKLREAISIINKAIASPLPEGSIEDPRELLRRKDKNSARDAAINASLGLDFGSESEGEDAVPDGLLFPPNPRSKSNALDELKKKRKKQRKNDTEKEPLDDETIEQRRQLRLANALSRQAKIKSDLFIHDSDEESDEEADKKFFELEEVRRKEQAENVKKALLTGNFEKATGKGKGKKPSVRKRKSDTGKSGAAAEPKRRRRGSSSAGSGAESDGDDDILMGGLDTQSPRSPQEVSTSRGAREDEDTPRTSDEDELNFDDDLAFRRDLQKPSEPEEQANDDEEDAPVASARRRMRGGFVLDSDSE